MHKVVEIFHKRMQGLNGSKLFAGIVMILLNIGSKYITVKLSKSQEAYLRNYVIREIIIFAIVFTATKDIYISLILTAVFFVLTQHLFNEESRICILPQKFKKLHKVVDTNNDGDVSHTEITEAIAILRRAKDQRSAKDKQKVYNYFTQNKI
jgi:hypothetical protein